MSPADPTAWQSSRVYSFLDYIMGGCQIHFTVSPRGCHAASRRFPTSWVSAQGPLPTLDMALHWFGTQDRGGNGHGDSGALLLGLEAPPHPLSSSCAFSWGPIPCRGAGHPREGCSQD